VNCTKATLGIFNNYALHGLGLRSLYIGIITLDQNFDSKPQNFPWGIPRPIGPQHKHHESPSSHFAGADILQWRPPSSIWIPASSAVHWAAAFWSSSTRCSVTAVIELLPWILSSISCSCASFASMEAIIVYASSIHGYRHAFKHLCLLHPCKPPCKGKHLHGPFYLIIFLLQLARLCI